jgi:hypothetical protein
MKIINGVDTPLSDDSEVELVQNHTKVVNASDNIFYENIPFEMLRTFETEP